MSGVEMLARRVSPLGEGKPNEHCTLHMECHGSEEDGDDFVHVEGHCDYLTLCGYCWPGGCNIWDTTEKVITCPGCREALKIARKAGRSGLRMRPCT